MVLALARALLASTPEGACAYLDADLREPAKILKLAGETLDFERPIAIMLVGILHHVQDTGETYDIVHQLVSGVPSGSYLAINHATNVVYGEASDSAVAHWNAVGKPTVTFRGLEEIAGYFDGLELVEPGLVSCSRWRHEAEPCGEPEVVDEFCAVGRKP